jgi:hypothetical protein
MSEVIDTFSQHQSSMSDTELLRLTRDILAQLRHRQNHRHLARVAHMALSQIDMRGPFYPHNIKDGIRRGRAHMKDLHAAIDLWERPRR